MSTRSSENFVRLTKTFVDSLPFSADVPVYYRDTVLPGLGLYVGKTAKTFFVEGRGLGQKHRAVIGPHHLYSPDTARKEGKRLLLEISQGKNPTKRKRCSTGLITLETAFNEYLKTRPLRPATVADYESIRDKDFKDWLNKPVSTLTKQLLSDRYQKLAKASAARANNALRVLRAVLNYAIAGG